jgi:hypothetical protein
MDYKRGANREKKEKGKKEERKQKTGTKKKRKKKKDTCDSGATMMSKHTGQVKAEVTSFIR